MEKITNDVAEVLVLQDKIFKGNFLKLLKIYVKRAGDGDKDRAEIMTKKIDEIFKDEKKATCLFVLAFMIGKAFTIEEYDQLETFIGNCIFD